MESRNIKTTTKKIKITHFIS